MNKITFITPIHNITEEEFNVYYKRALTSLADQNNKNFEYIVIYANTLDENIKTILKDNLATFNNCKLIEKAEDTDYCSMVNSAVSYVKTDFFSVLEFDDYFITPKWVNVGESYINAYPDISIFLSIIKQVNEKDELIGITNELFWALEDISNGEEPLDFNSIGTLSLDRALKKQKFDLAGSFINTEQFLLSGGLKKSIKVFFNQELLLRMLHQGNKALVIPKVGLSHTNFRIGSYLKNNENMHVNEINFYRGLSRKEYFFVEDRNIIYNENINE